MSRARPAVAAVAALAALAAVAVVVIRSGGHAGAGTPEPPPSPAAAGYVPAHLGRRVLAAYNGRLLLIDARGRVVSTTPLPVGGPRLVSGPGGVPYVVVGKVDQDEVYRYDAGRLVRQPPGRGRALVTPDGIWWWKSDGTVSRGAESWRLPRESATIAVVARPYGPVVVSTGARCAVTDLGEGREGFTDEDAALAPLLIQPETMLPSRFEACHAAAVDRDGRLVIATVERDAVPARAALVTVDVGRLATVRRDWLTDLGLRGAGLRAAAFAALPGGLVCYLRTDAASYVVDLRGPRPVARPVAYDHAWGIAAAGPDGVWLYGFEHQPARVDVSTGALTRNALPAAHDVATLLAVD